MKIELKYFCLVLIFCLSSISSISHVFAVNPQPTNIKLESPVTDLSSTLSDLQIQELKNKLLSFEQQNGTQVVVLIVKSTTPLEVAEFAHAVFEFNKLGRAKINDGVLMLVAKEDKKTWIEIGKGLEGAIPDIITWRIIRDQMLPNFKVGDYFQGINLGTDKLIQFASEENLAVPAHQGSNLNSIDGLITLVIFGTIFGTFLSNIFGRRTGSLVSSSFVGIFGILSSIFLGFFAAGLVFLLVRALTSASSNWAGGRMHVYKSGRGDIFNDIFSGAGGFGGGEFGGSSGWGGSGGSSSGGGASGSW